MLNLCTLRPINSMFSVFWSQAKLTLLIDSELFLIMNEHFFNMIEQVMVITAISNY